MTPIALAHPCAQPGCPALVRRGSRCPAHDPNRKRGSSTAQGYGRDWRRLRAAFLAANPLCGAEMEPHPVTQAMGYCTRPATDVDHITPRSKGGTDDWDNLQSLCHRHHSAKTARQGRWG